jgi:Universal stress protein family
MAFHPDLCLLAASDDRDLAPDTLGAIAQLSAACDVDLTVAHVATGGTAPAAPVHFEFALDAAPRRVQRREMWGGDAAGAVSRLCAEQPFDLVLAPARRAGAGWPLWRRSFRGQLLRLSGTPVWTAGRSVPGRHFQRPLRSVACLLDFDVDPEPLVQRAAAFARRMGARLHVLAVVPPVDDGTLAVVLTSDTPLLPAAAVARIEQMCAGRPAPIVDVVVDDLRRGLRRLVEMSQPDVLFVRAHQWVSRWPLGFSRQLDTLRCPVICVPDAVTLPDWTFERTTAARLLTAPGTATPAPGALPGTWPAGAPSRVG